VLRRLIARFSRNERALSHHDQTLRVDIATLILTSVLTVWSRVRAMRSDHREESAGALAQTSVVCDLESPE
jgi:hypothetical protein